MRRRPTKRKNEKKIANYFRTPVFAWCILVGCLMLFGVSFAWFTMVERVAESKPTSVMQPYYLTLLNPSETSALQLSVGSLMPGKTKQILFCVSNKSNEENELINMGGADFDYSLELIHTDNLALNYTLFALEATTPEEATESTLVAEDTVMTDGQATTILTYWNKGEEFRDETENDTVSDVSALRHGEIGLTGEEINSGTYISYESPDFHLKDDAQSGYDTQYFLLEIEWQEEATSNFEKYDKETDMIYLLVKALLPKPETQKE